MTRILIIEDDADLSHVLEDNLEQEGYDVDAEEDGAVGLARALGEDPDLILLDVMLPSEDGFTICREIRAKKPSLPIIVISARGSERDKVEGLDLGADDYVAKPFGLREILARVRAVLRRRASTSAPDLVDLGEAQIDLETGLTLRGRREERLSYQETEILRMLMAREGLAVSRRELVREVWGYDLLPGDRTVDNHIVRLRKIIEADPRHPQLILTVYGVGYRLVRSPG